MREEKLTAHSGSLFIPPPIQLSLMIHCGYLSRTENFSMEMFYIYGTSHSITFGLYCYFRMDLTVLCDFVSVFLTDGKLFGNRSNGLYISVSPGPSKIPGPE